jgi:nitric oxide reductase activation protein
MARPEPRKIAIIFSDGETNYNDKDRTRAGIKRMKADGIEVIGIGIQDHDLKGYLPETVVIQDLKELTPALMVLLKDKLCERR